MNQVEESQPTLDSHLPLTEIKEWENHLNTVTGLLAFTFGIAALGTPLPQFWAFFSFLFLVTFHISTTKNKMKKLRQLDNRKNRTAHENLLRKDIRKNLKVHRVPAFVFGVAFLMFLTFAPDLLSFPFCESTLNALYGDKPYASVFAFLKSAFAFALERFS